MVLGTLLQPTNKNNTSATKDHRLRDEVYCPYVLLECNTQLARLQYVIGANFRCNNTVQYSNRLQH